MRDISPSERFEEVCHALADPSIYPHPAPSIERIETHISVVFLAGDFVYKLKKPVDFGFLDYRCLGARWRYCHLEVQLNQRLSHGIYDGVVAVRKKRSGGYELSTENRTPCCGEVVEYAVRMKRLPEEASLRRLILEGKATENDMRDLGRRLASFYDLSERSAEIDEYGRAGTISGNMEENFTQLAPFVGSLVEADKWDFIREASRAFFQSRLCVFDRRISKGRVRDGHGDLRTEHVYFLDGIQIIDCIEFNDRFRYGDVMADLAFLHMDIADLGRSDLSLAMLEAYSREASDPDLYTVLDFYTAYRAVVKLKVACLRHGEVEDAEEKRRIAGEAASFLRHAFRYAVQFSRPTLWVFCGLPATGKSTVSGTVSHALSMAAIQSDVERKRMLARATEESNVVAYGTGIYRAELRGLVYAEMLGKAYDVLKGGQSVILDATFSKRHWRDEARRLAADLDTGILFVECRAPMDVIRERLRERERGAGASDARMRHLPHIVQEFEPFGPEEESTLIRVDADEAPPSRLHRLLAQAYALKSAQTDAAIARFGEGKENADQRP
jgi:aminoglycoside phosphotransferase family enzyme/predicted kinase